MTTDPHYPTPPMLRWSSPIRQQQSPRPGRSYPIKFHQADRCRYGSALLCSSPLVA